MIIRKATRDDLPQMLAIYAPYVRETTYSFEYRAPTADEFAGRFARITRRMPWLVAEEEGEVLGYAYADLPFNRAAYAWDAESSIYIHPAHHRRGLGTALYAALETCLTEMGFANLYAVVTGGNQRSMDFHEHLGFQRVATLPRAGFKFGRWYDVVWMMKILREDAFPGPAPVGAVDPREC